MVHVDTLCGAVRKALHINVWAFGDTEKTMSIPTNIDPETEQAARVFLTRIQVHYDLSRAILFGSRARHDHHANSDVDIALLLRGHPGRFLATKLDMADIAYDVLLETGLRVPIQWVDALEVMAPRSE